MPTTSLFKRIAWRAAFYPIVGTLYLVVSAYNLAERVHGCFRKNYRARQANHRRARH